jgi:hypothetical protein
MEAGQIAALVGAAAMLVILWPAARRALADGAPVLRWILAWVAVLVAVVLAYQLILAPMGIGLR